MSSSSQSRRRPPRHKEDDEEVDASGEEFLVVFGPRFKQEHEIQQKSQFQQIKQHVLLLREQEMRENSSRFHADEGLLLLLLLLKTRLMYTR